MKILHIVNDLIRGGSEGQCARVARGLVQRSSDIHRVAVFRRQGYFLDTVEETCGSVYEIPIRKLLQWNTLTSIRQLAHWIREEQFQLVHTWDAESTIFGGAACLLARSKLITSRRDLGEIYPAWKQHMLRWMDRRADRVVVNALAIGNHFQAQGLPSCRWTLIHNVMDTSEFDKEMRKQVVSRTAPVPEDTLKVICVSRLDPEKDHAMLLHAVNQVVKSKKMHLYIVGDGCERTRLQHQVEQLDIQPHVTFLGERMDIPQLLSEMDAGVLVPRSNEGLSNSILEYMAASLPVICTDCGGNKELVDDEGNGIIVPISHADAAASSIIRLTDPEQRIRMGRAGRVKLLRSFSMDSILSSFEELYQEVIGGHIIPSSTSQTE